ncbi:MAG: peptidase, partial [Acidobacteria bacterium]|nr:peptidase [Acidobacteriota bacterium]
MRTYSCANPKSVKSVVYLCCSRDNLASSLIPQEEAAMKERRIPKLVLTVLVSIAAAILVAAPQTAATKATSPQEQFGFSIGDDYKLITYTQLAEYWQKLDRESPRMRLEEIGRTAEGRPQYMAVITSPENHEKLARYKEISARLALAEGLTEAAARELAREGKAVVWIDGGLHATEVVGSHQLMEMVYQMVSLEDRETMRFLDDVILLAVHANPDGMELVSNWYMREPDPKKRSTDDIPRLYQKYIGHDNNRDSYMSTQPETTSMNRIMYLDWFPQVMYNHHQTGPSDIIVFVPPFRDPPNYYCDPLLVIGIESFGAAMHSRLIAEGKPGSGMRSRANYSIWFNGNVRTTGYFHNQIGLLTEMKGNPTPLQLSFFPDRQLSSVDMPFPHEPKRWHFRDAIEYSITLNRAVMDYASRQRETLLFNRFLMGRNSIDRGSRDHWTVLPGTVDQVNREAAKDPGLAAELAPTFRRRGRGLPVKYFDLLRRPENRDPRGYILPSDQPDFPTAAKFVDTLLKNGIAVHRAARDFQVGGRNYPAGSFVIKTAQAFRPHVLDMLEPQDHPNDFLYQGGPPVPPYDNAGYTLAYQMGVEFDRILEGFDGPFEKVAGPARPLPGKLTQADGAAGFLLSHSVNDSMIAVNRLLAAGH